MKIHIKPLLFLFCFVFTLGIVAQDRYLRIEDCFSKEFQPTTLRGLQWIPGSHKLSQVLGKALVITDPISKRNDTIFTLDGINEIISVDNATLSAIPAIKWNDENSFWFIAGDKLFVYNRTSQTAILRRRIPATPTDMEVAPGSLNVALVDKDNLYVYSAYGQKKITQDGGNGIVYGHSVHREEFGITRGLFWNNEGTKLAFYRMDEARVTDYSMVDIQNKPASGRKIKYPMAGDSSHTVTVGVYNTFTDEVIYLNSKGPYDQYLTNITWSPDGFYIYIAWINRDQNHMQLQRYNASTGELDKVIFEERHPKYVEPKHGPIFLPENNADFIWFSERDGFNHLYLYQAGKLARQLTVGNWEVTRFLGFDKDANGIYFEATKESPLERHAYYLKFKDKDPKYKKITSGAGTHEVTLNSFGGLILDVMSSRNEPKKYTVYKTDATWISDLHIAPNPLAEFHLGELRIEPVLVNGVALTTRTYLPPDFDPNKKYPVIVYVYGGPGIQLITESWMGGGNLWYYYMAQNGYIVYTVDNRGSANKGLNFENATYMNLGREEMKDQIAALNNFKQFPFVDSNRIGVFGWSYGGFMTTSLMTRYPGVYKVGVAGGPVIDWRYYEIMYTERYMNRPQDNADGYAASSLFQYAKNLQGRLLMIHGTDDDVVLWQHSLLYVKEMVTAGNANLDYFVYPGHLHNVQDPDKVHLYKKISQYFFDFL